MSQQGILSDLTTAGGDIETLTGDSGGAVGPNTLFNVNIVGGTGISTVGTPGSNQIVINSSGAGVSWNRVAGPAVAMVIDNGYIPTNAALVTLTLPATAAVGTIIKICGEGAGGWSIAQNAGQSIQFGNLSSTVGVGGSLDSSNQWDTVKLLCRVANTTWSVLSNVGILNVI